MTEILRIVNEDEDYRERLVVEAFPDEVSLTVDNGPGEVASIEMNQEETMTVATALLEALKTAWPVYAELDTVMNMLLREVNAGNDSD